MATTEADSNLELVRGLYEAFGEGDIDTVVEALDEDVTWIEAEGFPTSTEDGVFRGPQEVLEGVFAFLGEAFEGFTVVPDRFVDGGDTIVAIGTYSGTYGETGDPFEASFAHVWDLEGGEVTRFEQIADTALVRGAQ